MSNNDIYPKVAAVNRHEMTITLLRDGVEATQAFQRNAFHIVFPQNRANLRIVERISDYFIHTPDLNIVLTTEEAITLEEKIHEIDEEQYQLDMAEEAAKECTHCGKTQGECSENYDDDAAWENQNWDSRY